MEACAGLLEPREECLGWAVAPTRDLVDRVFLRVADTLKAHLGHRVLDLDLRSQRLVVSNLGGGTSELRGKSADMPVTLLGAALDFVIIDEAARLRAEIWEGFLSQRLVDRRGWALIVSTPSGCDWFYHMHRRAFSGADPEAQAWQSPSWENPFLDREVIEQERARLPPDVFAEMYGAVFIGAELESCLVCGGPSVDARGIVVVRNQETYPRCAACEQAVDTEGKTLVSRDRGGRPWLIVTRRVQTLAASADE